MYDQFLSLEDKLTLGKLRHLYLILFNRVFTLGCSVVGCSAVITAVTLGVFIYLHSYLFIYLVFRQDL